MKSTIDSNTSLPIVGILGDGQLAMMMAQAYQALGGQVFVFGSSDDSPASTVADKVIVGDVNVLDDVANFFNYVDVVTLENEFLDSKLLSLASSQSRTPVLPDPSRFGLIEDKLSEKNFFQQLGIRVADFFEVTSDDDLPNTPGYLKIAKGGYDGVGTYRVNNNDEARTVYNEIKSQGRILFEHAVEFQKELSLIGVSNNEEIVFYPMVETHQEQGTCRYVTYPSGITADLESQARSQVEDILKKLGTCGLFAFEFFLSKDNQLILNESAPRPHNSGHITLNLADCSQFENHMRAIAGLPLIVPQTVVESMTMINLLGTKDGEFNADQVTAHVTAHVNSRDSEPQSSLTLYRKQQSRVKRKMGHLNLWGAQQQQIAEKLVRILEV